MRVRYASVVAVLVLLHTVNIGNGASMFKMTERVYNKSFRELQQYVDEARSLPNNIVGLEPMYYIHSPGEQVYGTVIVFHGFGGSSNNTKSMSSFLFSERFNVIAVNQAGAGQKPGYGPKTVLRESAGYTSAKERIRSHPTTREIITDFASAATNAERLVVIGKYNGTMVQRLESALNGDQFRVTRAALQVLKSRLRWENATKEIRQYFETEHARHDAKAFSLAQLGVSLPGPRFMLGFSFGGTYTTYASSRSGDIDSAVLLAPFYGMKPGSISDDYVTFIAFASSIDLIPNASDATAAIISAYSAFRDSITRRMREQTKSFCVLAEDDLLIDNDVSMEVCNSKLGGRSFVYPKHLRIGHDITPDRGNPYGRALMVQVVQFFRTGKTSNASFFVRDNITSL